jgi:hypothetical protein
MRRGVRACKRTRKTFDFSAFIASLFPRYPRAANLRYPFQSSAPNRGHDAMKNRRKAPKVAKAEAGKREADYRHPEAETPLRPEVGTQAQFRKKKPPVTYRYDSSLSPALDWDGQNSAREQAEVAIRSILDLDPAPIETAATLDQTSGVGRPQSPLCAPMSPSVPRCRRVSTGALDQGDTGGVR